MGQREEAGACIAGFGTEGHCGGALGKEQALETPQVGRGRSSVPRTPGRGWNCEAAVDWPRPGCAAIADWLRRGRLLL